MELTIAALLIFFSAFMCSHGDIIVSKDGSGNYTTVGEAIMHAPDLSDKPYIIHVRAGTYEEYVVIPAEKTNIKLVGDGPYYTKLVGYQNGSTIDIHGAGFMAEKMGFVNSAGVNAGPALAVRNEANHSIFFECSIEGFQDTLWAVSGLQFYKNCDIYGTVDFIFGAAAAVFQDCMVYARNRQYVTFTAQAREHPEEKTAFTFQRCNFTMSPQDSNTTKSEVHATLGRPWRAYSTVAILNSYIDSMVDPKGWEEMPGQPTDKATYVEFHNVGPGSNTDARVKWPGVKVLHNPLEAAPFTASSLLDADSWIPFKGVPYDRGL